MLSILQKGFTTILSACALLGGVWGETCICIFGKSCYCVAVLLVERYEHFYIWGG